MYRIVQCSVLLVVLSCSLVIAAGNSHVLQLKFSGNHGNVHIKASEASDGLVELDISVNAKNLDPDTLYVVVSKGVVVAEGYPNNGGNLNLSGRISLPAGATAAVNIREGFPGTVSCIHGFLPSARMMV